jgi:hypothetical protein
MLGTLIKYVGRPALTRSPIFWPTSLKLLVRASPTDVASIYNQVLATNRELFQKADWSSFPNLKDTITSLLLTSYLREPLTDEIKTTLSQLPIPIFSIKGQEIEILPVWIDAIQKELSIDIFPQELFHFTTPSVSVRLYAERIHYLHKATYAALKLGNKKFTLRNIYRGAIASDEVVDIKTELSNKLMLERDETKIGGYKNIRVCSLKPHACENYDFDTRRIVKVIIARGMDESGSQLICALPTVMFTIHDKAKDRYKGNIDSLSLHTINRKGMDKFFYVFQPDFL